MILAVDPGLNKLGWAVVRHGSARVVELGVVHSPPGKELDEWEDRAHRAGLQAKVLGDLVEKYDIGTIAAETISVGGSLPVRYNMAVGLCLSWGALTGVAEGMGCELLSVTPKQWQHAVIPDVRKINYDELFARLSAFVGEQQGAALQAIKPDLRTHALDAVGVGVYSALLSGIVIKAGDSQRERSRA